MELLPIAATLDENEPFVHHPDCQESLQMCIDFYGRVGFNPPWICYYVKKGEDLVGSAAFKGQPKNGRVEIAYGTVERFRQQGVGTEICRLLVALARQTDPSVYITARTLPENNYSTRILEKNGFRLLGTVEDEEDGEVWEWGYSG